MTLHLGAAAAARVEPMWHALAPRAGNDDALRLGYARPITLAVLPDAASVEAIGDAAFRVDDAWHEPPVVLAGLGVLPDTPPVIWAAPIATERLLARRGKLHAALASFPVHPHHRPEAWVPHVSLSRRGRSSAARAVEVAASAWDGPINGRPDRLDSAEFRPVDVLRGAALRPAW